MNTEYVNDAECDLVVVGLGYVGLPTALMFAQSGLKTMGVDVNQSLLDQISAGRCPISEPDLVKVFDSATTRKNFTTRTMPPVAGAYVLAVPTPLDPRRKIADLTILACAAASIVPVLRPGALVIVESTIPPLTCREIVRPVIERTGLVVGKDIFLSHCPERLFPGNVVHEIVHNSRIIGGCCATATKRSEELYLRFVKGEMMLTDDVTAEFCKLMENAYRDVNIALANELAAVSDRLGIDVNEAIGLANKHPRVNVLKPGIGVGGHCIPIDPWFIAEVAPEESVLIPTARRVNDQRPAQIAAKIRRAVADIPEPTIAVYGVTYKPDVNDQRESPAWHIIEILKKDGYQVSVFDPVAGVGSWKNVLEFAAGHDALVILVEHQSILETLQTNAERLKQSLKQPLILRF